MDRAIVKYSLGLNWNQLQIIPYSTCWPFIYLYESNRIKRLLYPLVLELYHVGSTSVPYLGGKPIIDIVGVIENISDVYMYVLGLEKIGYKSFGQCGRLGRYFLTFNRGDITYFHLHLVQRSNFFWIDLIKFRNRLRIDSDLALSYHTKKIELVKVCKNDRTKYRNGKSSWHGFTNI